MMQVRIVRVRVDQWRVLVPMHVRFTGRVAWAMGVLMVHVVSMSMFVLQRLMPVFVLVALGEMQPKAYTHQKRSGQNLYCDRLGKHRDGERCANEGRHREIRSRARGAQISQGEDKKYKRNTIAEKANETCT